MRFSDYIKKADILLFIILVATGLTLSWFSIKNDVTGSYAIVKVNGKEYGKYSLYKDRTIKISDKGHLNIIKIKDGKVIMEKSSCRNQICVEHKAIHSKNESIVCLPNRVSIEIHGEDCNEDTIDAYS